MSSVIFPNQDSVVGDASGLAPGATVRVRYFAADYPGGKTTIPADAAQYSTFEDADGTVWQLTVTPPATGTWVNEADLATQAELAAEQARAEAAEASKVALAAVGQPNGVASLDETGKVPEAQLPAVGGASTLQDAYDGGAFIETSPAAGPVVIQDGSGTGDHVQVWANESSLPVAEMTSTGILTLRDQGDAYEGGGVKTFGTSGPGSAAGFFGTASTSALSPWGTLEGAVLVGSLENAGTMIDVYTIVGSIPVVGYQSFRVSIDPTDVGYVSFCLPRMSDTTWDAMTKQRGDMCASTTDDRPNYFDGTETQKLAYLDDIPAVAPTTEPIFANFTTHNTTGSTIFAEITGRDGKKKLTLYHPSNGSTHALRAATIPFSANHTVIMEFAPEAHSDWGIIALETSSGKAEIGWQEGAGAQALVSYWSNLNTRVGTQSTGEYSLSVSPHWWKIEDNGTNRITSYSYDGDMWTQLRSVPRTTNLTADAVGFFVRPYANPNRCCLRQLIYT